MDWSVKGGQKFEDRRLEGVDRDTKLSGCPYLDLAYHVILAPIECMDG